MASKLRGCFVNFVCTRQKQQEEVEAQARQPRCLRFVRWPSVVVRLAPWASLGINYTKTASPSLRSYAGKVLQPSTWGYLLVAACSRQEAFV